MKAVAGRATPVHRLRLYVAGQSPRSMTALHNLGRMCREHLGGRCRFEVVDLLEHPDRAQRDQIIAIPTLVKRWPLPLLRIVGDLSDVEYVLAGLELHAVRGGS